MKCSFLIFGKVWVCTSYVYACLGVFICVLGYLYTVCVRVRVHVRVCVRTMSGPCIVLYEEYCSLLRAVHQRVFKVMDEPLLQRSVGKTEKQSHRVTATISQMV